MSNSEQQRKLSEKRAELRRLEGSQWGHKGDPEGHRDHRERVAKLKNEIRELERKDR